MPRNSCAREAHHPPGGSVPSVRAAPVSNVVPRGPVGARGAGSTVVRVARVTVSAQRAAGAVAKGQVPTSRWLGCDLCEGLRMRATPRWRAHDLPGGDRGARTPRVRRRVVVHGRPKPHAGSTAQHTDTHRPRRSKGQEKSPTGTPEGTSFGPHPGNRARRLPLGGWSRGLGARRKKGLRVAHRPDRYLEPKWLR